MSVDWNSMNNPQSSLFTKRSYKIVAALLIGLLAGGLIGYAAASQGPSFQKTGQVTGGFTSNNVAFVSAEVNFLATPNNFNITLQDTMASQSGTLRLILHGVGDYILSQPYMLALDQKEQFNFTIPNTIPPLLSMNSYEINW